MVGTRNTLQFILVKTTIFYKSNCRHKRDSWWTQGPSQKNMAKHFNRGWSDWHCLRDGWVLLKSSNSLFSDLLFIILFAVCFWIIPDDICRGSFFLGYPGANRVQLYARQVRTSTRALSDYVDFTKIVLRAQYTMIRWSRTWPENFPFLAYFLLSKMPWRLEEQNVKTTLKFFPF